MTKLAFLGTSIHHPTIYFFTFFVLRTLLSASGSFRFPFFRLYTACSARFVSPFGKLARSK